MHNIVERNKKYLLLERPTKTTPKELRKHGLYKMGTGFSNSYPLCPTNKQTGRHETGLNKYSSEFIGEGEGKVKKSLEERKELVQLLNELVEASEYNTEKEYLQSRFFEAKHEKTIDTANMNDYLDLWLVMQGYNIVPESRIGNPRYNNARYVLVDFEQKESIKEKRAKQKFEVNDWLFQTLKENKNKAVEYLRYADLLGLNDDGKDAAVISDLVQNKINSDIDILENLHTAIDRDWETNH